MKRVFTLCLLGLLICSLLAGCAASADSNANGKGQMLQSPGAAGEGIYDNASNQETTEIIGRKLIRTINIEAETKDLDALMADLDAQWYDTKGTWDAVHEQAKDLDALIDAFIEEVGLLKNL